MKLSKEVLPDYFTMAGPANSHYKTITNSFDFIGNGSKTLVVTVGESWTWGSDITVDNDKETRLSKVYGRLIAEQLNSDWLNLSLPGAGNFWIANTVGEFINISGMLEYDKIYLICTLTEIGRSFDSDYDRYIDYINWFNTTDNYNKLFNFLNKECIEKIQQLSANNDRIILRIGSNFVDLAGFDDSMCCLKNTWLDCVLEKFNIKLASKCYTAMHGLQHLEKSEQFIKDKSKYLEWMTELIELATERLDILSNKNIFRNYHPLESGHRIWADYILGTFNV